MRKSTKLTAVVGGGALVVVTAGAAYAYWTATGTGSGSASTGNVVGITINQTSTPAALYPGGPTGELSGTFTNTNSGKVFVEQVTATIKNVNGTAWSVAANATKPACTADDFTIVQPTVTHAEVATGDTWSGGSIALRNLETNQDNCKGVTPPIQYSSN